MSLMSCFESVKDPRRAQGLRTSLSQIFSMVTVSYLCGYCGYRSVSIFCKSNEDLFSELLGLKHPVPSHVTFRQVLQSVDEKELIKAFNTWAASYGSPESGDWVSGDGKSMNSTVINYDNKTQDFQSIVSFFCQKSGLVAKIQTFRNKKKSEIEVVLELIKDLETKGLILRFDALHTQKKL